jgi:hypothetical protein
MFDLKYLLPTYANYSNCVLFNVLVFELLYKITL